MKSLKVSESSSESWPRRLGLALQTVSSTLKILEGVRTHTRPDHTEVAALQLAYLGRSIDHCSTRLDSLADGPRSSRLPVGIGWWHRHCSIHCHS